MGQNLEQVLAVAPQNSHVRVTIATNQEDGVVAYAVGSMIYRSPVEGHFTSSGDFQVRRPSLSTTGGKPLTIYYSDRMTDIDTVPGQFPSIESNPFSEDGLGHLDASVTLGDGPRILKVAFAATTQDDGLAPLHDVFDVPLEPLGDLLVGVGRSLELTWHQRLGLEHRPPDAVYVVSFQAP